MAEKKRHHFVSQFYLRNFSDRVDLPAGERPTVPMFNIDRQQFIQNASIANQCQQDYLYGKSGEVEDKLAELEGHVSKTIREIIECQRLPDRESDNYIELILFISFQLARSPKAGESFLATQTQLARALLTNNPSMPPDLRKHIDELQVTHENPVLYQMGIGGRQAFLFDDLSSKLLRNDSELGFITSDLPCVKFNQWAQDATTRGVLGLACCGLQVFWPLSPKFMLFLHDPDVYTTVRRGELVPIDNNGSVKALNALQLTSSVDNLYFGGDTLTASSILELPFSWRDAVAPAPRLVEAQSESDQSTLLHQFQPIVGRLDIPEVRLQAAVRTTPLDVRANTYRPKAMAADEHINGPRASRYGPPPSGRKTFKVSKPL